MKEKLKKKKGIARLFEIAGERKGLLILAGILSAGSATCMLVPYWSVYRVLQELLLHASDLEKIDSGILIYWGWFAFFGLIGGLLLLYAALMASHVAAFRILYGLRIKLSEHIGRLSLGYLNGTSTGSIKKIMEQNVEKIENFIAHTRPCECIGYGHSDVYYLLLPEWMDGSDLSILYRIEYRITVCQLLREKGTGVY